MDVVRSDFVYMVPPFLAYYGVLSENRTLLLEAYNQIKLYRNYLRDPKAQNRWKHVLLGQPRQDNPNNDEGYWTTGAFLYPFPKMRPKSRLKGNGWAAAGILRVLATIRNSQYANTLKGQQKDLSNWVKEIHDGMYALLVRTLPPSPPSFPHPSHPQDPSVNLWTNYPDVPPSSPGNFYDASGSALLASTVFRGAVMLNQFTHVPAAEKIRTTLFSPPTNSSPTTTPPTNAPQSQFANYPHFTNDGWLTPVVNPYSYGQEGSESPESEAFALQLHSAWRDWVQDGARGANAAVSLRFARRRCGWEEAGGVLGWLVDGGGWMWLVCGCVVGSLLY